jgi:hypothetical protein
MPWLGRGDPLRSPWEGGEGFLAQEILNTVFDPTTGHHLNLVTCSGVWTGNGYDQRLVVFITEVS